MHHMPRARGPVLCKCMSTAEQTWCSTHAIAVRPQTCAQESKTKSPHAWSCCQLNVRLRAFTRHSFYICRNKRSALSPAKGAYVHHQCTLLFDLQVENAPAVATKTDALMASPCLLCRPVCCCLVGPCTLCMPALKTQMPTALSAATTTPAANDRYEKPSAAPTTPPGPAGKPLPVRVLL